VSRYSFGGFQRFNSARKASIPAASIFAHSAGGRRIERRTMTSSGGLGGLPRGRFCSSMGRTVAPIYRGTNNPCNLELSCYSNCMSHLPHCLTNPNLRMVKTSVGFVVLDSRDRPPLLQEKSLPYYGIYKDGVRLGGIAKVRKWSIDGLPGSFKTRQEAIEACIRHIGLMPQRHETRDEFLDRLGTDDKLAEIVRHGKERRRG
jgi:hypothetical protein